MTNGPMNWLRGHVVHINVVLTVLVAVQCLLIGVGVEHPRLIAADSPVVPPTSTPVTGTPQPHQRRPPLLAALRQAGQITVPFQTVTVVAIDQNAPAIEVQTKITLRSTVDAAALTQAQLGTQGAVATVMMPQVVLTVVDPTTQTYVGAAGSWQSVSSAPQEVQQFAVKQLQALTNDTNTICRVEFDVTGVLQQHAWQAGRNLMVKFPDPQC
jgi:hypothetical protein